MKRALWIPALILLAFVGDRVGGYLLSRLVDQSQFRYTRLYNGAADADILLVGNSRGLMFFQPYIEESTGKETFNISYNGMPMDLGQALIADYLDRYEAPELMILDITMCDRINTSLIAGFAPYGNQSDRLKDLIFSSDANTGYATEVSHLYRYNGEIFQRAIYYANRSDEDWLLDRVISPSLIEKMEGSEENFTFEMPAPMLKALKETVALAESKGVKVNLVINPYYPPYAARIDNLTEVKEQIERETGLIVHNYAEAVSDYTGFGDYQHLNKKGSKQYIEVLLKDQLLHTADRVGVLTKKK